MAFQPQPPFPKSRGDTVRSSDWNDLVGEVRRLDSDKVNRAGDKISGGLSISGSLAVGTNVNNDLALQVQSSGADRPPLAVLSTPNSEDFLSLFGGRRNSQLPFLAWKRGDLRVGTASAADGTGLKEMLRVNSSDTAAARLEVDGRVRAGQLLSGPWPANPTQYGFVGVNSLDQTQAGNYALIQGSGSDNGTTYLNSPTSVRLRTNNNDQMIVNSNGTINVKETANLNFGNQTRQMLTLWNPDYGIGVQNSTLYFRSGNNFAWYRGSSHNDNVFHPGNNGRTLMRLDINGNLFIRGQIFQNVNFSDPVGPVIGPVIGPILDPGIPVISPSDARLKQNIAPLEGALDRLLQLRGVTFDWNEPNGQERLDEPQIGLIAQEVEAVFPQWVRSGSEGYKQLAIRGFEALTVEALRTLQAENEELRRRIAQMESGRSNGHAAAAGAAGQASIA